VSVELAGKQIEVGIVATNLDAMIEFYEGFLGLELSMVLEFPGGRQRRYQLGHNVVKLVTYDDHPVDGTRPGGGLAQGGIRYLSMFVKDLQQVAADLEASPYEIVEPLTEFEAVPGMYWLFVADPDGNWIELAGEIATDAAGGGS
jgi:catechol 2,3-dioxygenase-like lactoylglutathione lyase family enzyme